MTGILTRLDAMNELLAILRADTRLGPIGRVSLAPWSWNLLWQCDFVIVAACLGDSGPDEEGRVRSLDGWYVCTQYGRVMVGLDPLQSVAYRLWDRRDRELVRDRRGRYDVVADESRR